MRTISRALLGLMPAAFVMPLAVNAPRVEGYLIKMRVTGTGTPNEVTFKVAGEKMRIEADLGGMMGRGGGAAMAEGAYILPGNDGNIIMVAPNASMGGAKGMAMSMNPAGMMAARGAAPPPVGNVSIEDLGAGEAILGHPTHKYRVKPSDPQGTADIWLATDIPGLDYKKFAAAFGARFSGTDAKIADKLPTGFAMKVVPANGQGGMEVTKIEKTSFSDAEFEVPPGIQVMDLSSMMGGRGRGQ